ncbi:MAG: peptidoglycan-binding protein, partial [Pedobacter sp.]
VFDEETRTAVGKLQQANQLPLDYIVDQKVVAYLNDDTTPPVPDSLLGNRLLQWGVSGADVVELKRKLIQKGFLKGDLSQIVTDRFDEATEKAVKALQQANGLDVTGKVTEAVIRLLI